MATRLLHIIVLCIAPLCGLANTFSDMVTSMTPQSLPLVNLEIYADSVSYLYFVPGKITIADNSSGDSIAITSYNCVIRKRGKTALFLPKISFSVKLVDEEGEKLDANLLGLRNDNTWILDAMGIDKLRMRNRVCFDIWNEFSHTMWETKFNNRNGTVGTMVEVFVDGVHNGIYCLSDKINRQLLNLRKVKEDIDSVTIKGLLYKGKNSGLTNNLLDYEVDRTDTVLWNTFELQYPEEYPSTQAWQPLIDLIDFNGKTADEYFKAHYSEYYYIDNLVDYWILIAAFGLIDMPYKNTFLSTPDINFGHRFMITPWDLDACMGRNPNGVQTHYYPMTSRLNAFAPFNRLITHDIDGIKNRIARRWFQLIEAELSPENVESHIDAIQQRYVESGAWQREYDLWKDEEEDERIIVDEDIYLEKEFVMTWYRTNINRLSTQLNRWRDDYVEEETINSSTITQIYNFLLGIDTTFYPKLDINGDGEINSNDITAAYNILLGQE